MFSATYFRFFVVLCLLVLFASGYFFSTVRRDVYEHKHNWRLYLDGLSGGDSRRVGFNASCVSDHDVSFSRPSLVSGVRRVGDFGHAVDSCWPPPPVSVAHPASSLTSLGFLCVGLLYVVCFPASGLNFVAVSLAFAAAGSYRHHAVVDASGRALDHAAVAVLGTSLVVHLACACVSHAAFQTFVRGVGLVAIVSSIASGHIGDNAFVLSLFSASGGAILSLCYPAILVNVLLPIVVGHYAASVAEEFMSVAECNGSVSSSVSYDVLHSLWHVCACVASLEVLCFSSSVPFWDFDGRLFVSDISWISVLCSVCVFLCSVLFPSRGEIGACVFFFLSLGWCVFLVQRERPAKVRSKDFSL